ncbi:hypothetical protein A0H81_12342 [Grifola frondosa]|uniref:HNH nuclease domain-containing protein n=1 Tax=Grifola frondosa TaxID=5627 RepID=A0A1C7LSJ8_GRIFR|nr:hypothetical protein A0H81_12342 [Grifola frondosa]
MTPASVPTVTIHIPLPHDNHTNIWYRALEIPVHRLSHFSNSPLRWLCYLGFALTASKGKLCESDRPEGDEYITHLTTFRSCEDDDPVISDIDDIRNGLLVNSILYNYLHKTVAFLQTPNFILSPRHVDPENTSDALCIYSHDFQETDNELLHKAIGHGKPLRLPQSLDSWPSHTIFATIYGAVALKTWPVQAFVDEIRKRWKGRPGVHNNRDGGLGTLQEEQDIQAARLAARQQQIIERAKNRAPEQDEDIDMVDIIMMLRQHDEQQRQSLAQEQATTRSRDKVEEWLRDSAAA